MRRIAQALVLAGAATMAISVAACQKYPSGDGAASADGISKRSRPTRRNGTSSSRPMISRGLSAIMQMTLISSHRA